MNRTIAAWISLTILMTGCAASSGRPGRHLVVAIVASNCWTNPGKARRTLEDLNFETIVSRIDQDTRPAVVLIGPITSDPNAIEGRPYPPIDIPAPPSLLQRVFGRRPGPGAMSDRAQRLQDVRTELKTVCDAGLREWGTDIVGTLAMTVGPFFSYSGYGDADKELYVLARAHQTSCWNQVRTDLNPRTEDPRDFLHTLATCGLVPDLTGVRMCIANADTPDSPMTPAQLEVNRRQFNLLAIAAHVAPFPDKDRPIGYGLLLSSSCPLVRHP